MVKMDCLSKYSFCRFHTFTFVVVVQIILFIMNLVKTVLDLLETFVFSLSLPHWWPSSKAST